ncbi:MAG: 3D domain-containing protein [Fimbriimonadales bacterium]|nr:3D domain-containing protein [Fimbriimonadales bacterium]
MRQQGNTRWGGGWRWYGLLTALALLVGVEAQARQTGRSTVVYCVEKMESIPPPTIFEVNRRLQPRQRLLVQQGEPGLKRSRWRVVQRNGRLVERQLLESEVLKPPQPHIYHVGVHRHIASRGQVARGSSFRTTRVLEMEATAYTAHRSGGGTGTGRTASGLPAGYGLVAVDPRLIPFGTVLYIEGYGMAIAADKGRAIRGRRIDLFFHSRKAALQFGRRRVRVHVLVNSKEQIVSGE